MCNEHSEIYNIMFITQRYPLYERKPIYDLYGALLSSILIRYQGVIRGYYRGLPEFSVLSMVR